MQIDEYTFPDDLYFQKDHYWARVEGDVVVIGVSDFAQKLAGTIKRVVTLEEEDEVVRDKPIGTLSSGKWTGKLYSPVSGEIVEVNEDIEDEPNLINDDPYGEGWVLKIEPSDLDADLAALKKPGPEFEAWMKNEIEDKKQMMK
ncbi:MAG: glycine cleavage system protein GcvH [Thermoplasmata archaeon]|nr:glycine cleavage system protein GcvH [Thermoplasmata archaeon]